jgi:hypothetical protein
MDDADRYRCRRIYLKQSDNTAYQANAACEALANIDGILLAAPVDVHCMHIIYSLDTLSFEIVIDLLDELEFETDKSLLLSLRSTIFGFLEDNARDNMQLDVTEFQQDDSENPDPAQQQDDEKYWDDYR